MFGGEVLGRLLPSLCAAAALGAVAIAGCGDDDADSTASEQGALGAANEPPQRFVERLATLLKTSTEKDDCTSLDDISSRSFVRFPCPVSQDIRKSMASFKLAGVKEYGAGAVADYKSGSAKDGAAILLYIAPTNSWGVSRFGVFTKPSTKTSDEESREGYDAALDAYLAAVRKRDCQAFAKVKFVVDTNDEEICKTLFGRTKDIAKRLRANPSAEPEYQGGNATYGFYAFQTPKPKPKMWTISVMKTGASSKPYAVLDVAPSPTAAQQRSVQEQFRKKLNPTPPDQPETSPSRKAS
jgi:hypothetical protein